MHETFRTLTAGQSGLFTTGQWRQLGGSEAQLRAQTGAGRWRALNELVMCTHNGPLTVDQRDWAAILSAQGIAALTTFSGLRRFGVRGFDTTAVHLLVRRGAKVLPIRDVEVRVHESRRFAPGDLLDRQPPVMSLERCAIDAAAWAPDVRTAFRIVIAPVQQRLTSATRLLEVLDVQGRIRFVRQLRAFLNDVSGGAQALSEVEFLRWCRRHGFPRPDLQVRVDAAGRRRFLDAQFTGPDGHDLWVEIDGGVHLLLSTRWEDTLKDNDAVIDGRSAIRFMSSAIYADDPRAVAQLRRALALVRL